MPEQQARGSSKPRQSNKHAAAASAGEGKHARGSKRIETSRVFLTLFYRFLHVLMQVKTSHRKEKTVSSKSLLFLH
jgi:hypothetical protein